MQIPKFTDGRASFREHLNKLVDVCNSVLNARGGNGVAVRVVPGGGMVISGVGGGMSGFSPGTTSTGLQMVLVTVDGGTDGTSGSFASWTYTIAAFTDTAFASPLATNVSPENSRARAQVGKVNYAGVGSTATAYVDASGNWHLWDVLETRATPRTCES